jgi:hypothetical protein
MGDRLGEKAMSRFDVFHMIKRRAKAAALPYSTCCHTFRATGITTYLENGGTLEHAQTIANHESPGPPSSMTARAKSSRPTRSGGFGFDCQGLGRDARIGLAVGALCCWVCCSIEVATWSGRTSETMKRLRGDARGLAPVEKIPHSRALGAAGIRLGRLYYRVPKSRLFPKLSRELPKISSVCDPAKSHRARCRHRRRGRGRNPASASSRFFASNIRNPNQPDLRAPIPWPGRTETDKTAASASSCAPVIRAECLPPIGS